MRFFETEHLYFVRHESEIPWIKIFTNIPYVELSDCDEATRNELFKAILVTEKVMRQYYKPDKINIASFGNYLPHVHFHVQARFKEDSHFPEPMWGLKERESNLEIKDFDGFVEFLKNSLEQ